MIADDNYKHEKYAVETYFKNREDIKICRKK